MGGYLTTGGSLLIGLLATQEGKVYVRMSDVANGYKTYVHVFDGTSWTNTVSGNFPSGTVGRSTMFRDPTTGVVYTD